MKSLLLAAVATAVLGAAGAASAADVEIKNAVARVVVIPEAGRTEVKVEIIPGATDLPALTVRTVGGKTIIDGDLKHRIHGCSRFGIGPGSDFNPTRPPENMVVKIKNHADVKLKDAALVTIRTPMNVSVATGEAVFGSIGRADSVSLGVGGCGDWTVANTRGKLDVDIGGSGDVRTGTAGDASVNIGGSGDVHLGSVGNLEIKIGGSGDVVAERAAQTVTVTIGGSGDVAVKNGAIDHVKVTIAGSGDVDVNADVQDLNATIMGNGDVHVRSAQHVSKTIMGGGSVTVGN